MEQCAGLLIVNCTLISLSCSDVCVIHLRINTDNEMRGIKINMLFWIH